MQQPEGKYLKQLFDYFFDAPLEVWEVVSQYVTRRTFRKNEIIKDATEFTNLIGVQFGILYYSKR